MKTILKWIVMAVAVYAAFWIGEKIGLDMRPSEKWQENLLVALLLGLVNAFVAPIVKLLTIPINCMTFGIAGLIINVLLFWMVFAVSPFDFKIGNFWAALFASIMVTVINGILKSILGFDDEKK